jgi:hypothetical protein
LTPKLVSPVADRKVRSVKATQLADHLDVCHLRHLRLQVRCLKARRHASIALRQVVNVSTIIIVDGEKPSVHPERSRDA